MTEVAAKYDLSTLRHRWTRAGAAAVVLGVVIAVPTRVVPNAWFTRMTPVRGTDYLMWIAISLTGGFAFALARRHASGTAAGNGVAAVFAVGCPICNKLVVALLGTGGAMSVFAPLQPLIGITATMLNVEVIRRSLRVRPESCKVTVNA